MRCLAKDCDVVVRHPNEAKCWKKFRMCKYHAFEIHPELYEGSYYRPISSKFIGTMQKIENVGYVEN